MSACAAWDGITAISFDGDGTLWDFQGAMRRAMEETLDELGRLVPRQEVAELTTDELRRIRDGVANEWRGRGARLEEIRLEAFRRTVARVGRRDEALVRHLYVFYMERRFAGISLYPDVLSTLDALTPRYGLGLISNGNTYPERCGLAGRFTLVLFAQDCGFAKPDPRIFACALQRADWRADQLLHVGDSLSDDVRGAQRAGIKAIWLNRANTLRDTEVVPDSEITTLTELPPLLRGR